MPQPEEDQINVRDEIIALLDSLKGVDYKTENGITTVTTSDGRRWNFTQPLEVDGSSDPLPKQVEISKRALVQRIGRVLKRDRKLFVADRNSLDTFYVIVGDRIVDTCTDLDSFGRECGALHDYEVLSK